ncbi:MAG: hypothetical protein ACM3UV_06365 [Nocardioidaceae bacterium]
MEEILPGVWHWSRFHERIRQPVHSYYLSRARVVIDPMVPEEGLEWFVEAGDHRPGRVLLSIRHHYRQAGEFVRRFGIPVLCNEAGLHEFEGGPEVHGFAVGDELAPGVIARELDAICPDETALHALEERTMSIGDAAVRVSPDGELRFVPDSLLGDDPEAVKQALRAALRRLCSEYEFDALLPAHGEPIVSGGREALARLAG